MQIFCFLYLLSTFFLNRRLGRKNIHICIAWSHCSMIQACSSHRSRPVVYAAAVAQSTTNIDLNRRNGLSLDQWFSTGVTRNPLVPRKAQGVPPTYDFDVYLLVNCSQGCRQIVLKRSKGAANQKRLRNTALDKTSNFSMFSLRTLEVFQF